MMRFVGSDEVPGAALWPVEAWLRRRYGWFAGSVVTLVVLNELLAYGINLLRWDWLLVTGFVTFLLALRSALQLPDRIHEGIRRLSNRRALVGTEAQLADFERLLHRSGRRGALIGGIFCAVVLGAMFWFAFPGTLLTRLVLLVAEVAAAVLVGFFVGRAVAYGMLGGLLEKRGLTVEVYPEHLDGAGGLRPVGDYFFFQATLLAVPAAYLAIWWLLFPVVGRYDNWRMPYVGGLAFLVLCQIGAFLLPLRKFHRIMKKQKQERLVEADKLSHDASTLRDQLRDIDDDEESKRLEERLTRLTQRYQAIDKMSTWPMGVSVRRRFAVNNIVLFIPVAAQILGASESLQKVMEGLQKAVSGQS
jgi:hypothetical protein